MKNAGSLSFGVGRFPTQAGSALLGSPPSRRLSLQPARRRRSQEGAGTHSSDSPIPPRSTRCLNGARSGIVYLLSLLVVLVVSGVALAMGQGTGQRLHMQQQAIAQAQCEAAALGLVQALLADLDASRAAGLLPQLLTVQPAGEIIGDCTVLLVGRDPSGVTLRHGLIPEAGRINIADTTVRAPVRQALNAALGALPGMDPTISAAITDWCDADDTPDADVGAERSDGAYTGATVPYAPRNAPMQHLEELRLVRGVTDDLYFGEDRNGNGVVDAGEDVNADGRITPGLREVCTLYSREPPDDGSTRFKITNSGSLKTLLVKLFGQARGKELGDQAGSDVFTSRLGLMARFIDMTEDEADALWVAMVGPEGRVGMVDAWSCNDDLLVALVGSDVAQAIIAARPNTMPTGPSWLIQALGPVNAVHYGPLLTVGSYVFRADVLAVRNDGAGWTRLEAIIDSTGTTARVLGLRSCTTLGWPFPGATLDRLRRSRPNDVAAFLSSSQP